MKTNNLNSTPSAVEELPLVSVVIPVYNADRFLPDTLESILRQTYRRIEVIAVNDGSTDSSREILNNYSDRIRCIHQANQGVATARNVGVAHSQGSFIAFCDSDDIWFPQKLEWQMEIVERHPSVGVVGSAMEEIDELGKTVESCQKVFELHDKPMNLKQILLMEGNVISMSTSIIRKNIFEKINGFQIAHSIIYKAEDYDLWIQASEETTFYVSSQYVGQYRVLKKSRSHGNLRKEYRAEFLMLRKYRKEYSLDSYKIRKAKIYAQWAESSFFEGERDAWKLHIKAIKLHPGHLSYQISFGWEFIKNIFKRTLFFLKKNIDYNGKIS